MTNTTKYTSVRAEQSRAEQSRADLCSEIPAVAVIMSTYNGEKYLAEQINSILAQEDVHVELFIRDDGSADTTRNILSEYSKHNENIHVTCGNNLGVGMSFITELKSVSGFEYYAFSDQDDLWKENKLITAIQRILEIAAEHGNAYPILYCSNVYQTDEKLNVINRTTVDRLKHSLESIIVRRNLAGCTMVFNRTIYEAIQREVPSSVLSHYHDSLIASVCCSLGGKIFFDPEAHILQREHNDNTTGVHDAGTILKRIRKELNIIRRGRHAEPRIASWIIQNFGDRITPEARTTLELVADCKDNFGSRLKILVSHKFSTGDWRITIFGKVKMLLGLL